MAKKSKYETHVLPNLERIEAWTRDGVSEKDVAANLGVAYSTFREYKRSYPALSALLTRTRDYVDNVVVTNAYLRRVTGYDAVEVRREYLMVPQEGGGLVRTLVKEIEQVRHIPPDPRAGEFWLTNRQPDLWKYKPEGGSEESEGGGVIELAPADPEPTPPTEEGED